MKHLATKPRLLSAGCLFFAAVNTAAAALWWGNALAAMNAVIAVLCLIAAALP